MAGASYVIVHNSLIHFIYILSLDVQMIKKPRCYGAVVEEQDEMMMMIVSDLMMF